MRSLSAAGSPSAETINASGRPSISKLAPDNGIARSRRPSWIQSDPGVSAIITGVERPHRSPGEVAVCNHARAGPMTSTFVADSVRSSPSEGMGTDSPHSQSCEEPAIPSETGKTRPHRQAIS